METALGIGSSTPWGQLAISTVAGSPALSVGSTTTQFVIDKMGNLGVATSSPWARFSIASGGAIVVAENTLATTTSMTVDWRNGNQQLVRLGTSATTVTFSGYVAGQRLMLTVCNPGTTAGTLSWGTSVLWPGSSAPTQTTTANKCDIWSFVATQATSTLRVFGSQSANF